MKKILALILLMALLMGVFSIESSEPVLKKTAELTNSSFGAMGNLERAWFQKTQVYGMVALPPNDVQKFHITVNGLWNGFFADNLSSPFAYGIYFESAYSGKTYESDEEFVQSQHDQGLLVPGTILTTQGHESLQGDLLEEFACRSLYGEMCYWDQEAGSYWMCASNPDFIDWCIEHGKKAIDAGADLIVLDEIQGNGFFPMYQWAAQYLGTNPPGFSNHTIEGFRTYLKEKFTPTQLQNMFGIDDIDNHDLRNRIAETIDLTYLERISTDPLIKEYITYLEESNYHAKKRLIQELREYATDQGKDIAIGANSYALGTNRGGGYWPKGLQFSELLDFFTFENKYTTIEGEKLPNFPRNKWLAWEKLARAATGAPAVILMDTEAVVAVNPNPCPLPWKKYYTNYLSIHCAEAYANRGSFVNYYFKPWGKPDNWNGCGKIGGFVLDHQDLYDAEFIIDTPVAILYLYGEGMRTKTDTYLGLAQALAESNIPFEVIFDGDKYYINESLTLEKLSNYDFILVPSVIDITDSQESIIKEYVSKGGKALVFNPEAIGFDPIDGEVEYGNGSFIFMLQDKGMEYYHTYSDSIRQDIEDVTKTYTGDIITVENADRKIVSSSYYQPTEDRVMMHLVNYDHTKSNDEINPKEEIRIRIKKPPFDVGGIYIISPDFEGKTLLDPTIDEEYVEFVVPSLEIYNVIVIEKQSNTKSLVRLERPEEGCLYVFDKKVTLTPSEKTIIFGKISINVIMQNEEIKSSKVEFYVDDLLKATDVEVPYIWTWNEIAFGDHEIKIIAYDHNGNNASKEITVWKFF